MILGRFFTLPPPQGCSHPIIYPFVDVTINLPRLSVSKTLPLLVDTGADDTCLHLRDAYSLLGLRGYSTLRGGATKTKRGIGGSQEYYPEQAWITFEHHDGAHETYDFEVGIVVPYLGDPKRLVLQSFLPSVLGWDILQYFRLISDYSRNELFFDHP